MKIVVWVLYVVLTNANGDPMGVTEMEAFYESKEACRQKAVAMQLYVENYGCRPVFADAPRN